MLMCHGRAFVLLVVLYPIFSGAVNFTQCLADVTNCATNLTGDPCVLNITNTSALSVLRTSKGAQITTASDLNSTEITTAISFDGCTAYCGIGQEPFSWSVFSQEYSAWLLPYLALLSQLPFGARRRTDNLMSAILTLGSPTLAGYSLYVTLLNSRWVNDRLFAGIDYPSATVRRSVIQVLNSLQQVPVRVHPGPSGRFESLVIHPDNDIWWSTFAAELDYSHTWSIASATSITWVVIAFLLTVADSLSNVTEHIQSSGQGTGSVWLWLLPIVVGWLVLSPKCDFNRVREAYDKANRHVVAARCHNPHARPHQVTSNFGLTISPTPDWKESKGNTSCPDESRIPPVFNYARMLSWSRTAFMVSLFYRAAWEKSNVRTGVGGRRFPSGVHCEVPRESRLGNRNQTIRYCYPCEHEVGGEHNEGCRINDLWPRGVLFNMVVASLMSLQLQWGTTLSAVLVVWYTPTIGLGCRSLAYVIYGGISTLVWFLLVSSNALGYYAHHMAPNPPSDVLELQVVAVNTEEEPLFSPATLCAKPTFETDIEEDRSGTSGNVTTPILEVQCADDDPEEDMPINPASNTFANAIAFRYTHPWWIHLPTIFVIANWLRRIGKTLAVINAIGIIANSVFQYAGVYDNCFCNSSVFTWGSAAFNVVDPNASDIRQATSAWTGALALALTSSGFFLGTIYLVRDSVPSYARFS